jgi:hypothetical protein
MDAAAGDGGAFWDAYANEVLPAAEALTVPFCLPDALLRDLRSPAVAAGAREQQARGPRHRASAGTAGD